MSDSVTAKRHIQNYSIELLDASFIATGKDSDDLLYEAISRLVKALRQRFDCADIRSIFAQDPERKTAFRLSIQLVDEGANDSDIRLLSRYDHAAFDEFLERERAKLLRCDSKIKPQ